MDTYRLVKKEDIEDNLLELRHIVFEVTDACNLNCKYCGYADLYEGYDKRENLYFPFRRAQLLIDYLYHNYWIKKTGKGYKRTISIGFYGGEPLLNVPFIKQVIGYIEQLPYIGIAFQYSMTTNAMLLNRYMDYLVKKNFSLLISLDGDEIGQSYRVDAAGQNSFKRVFQNICLLRSTYPSFFEEKVNFNSVLHNRNSIETTINFIKENFDKIPRLSSLSQKNVREEKRDEFNRMYRNAADDLKNSSKCGEIEKELFVNAPRIARLMEHLRNSSDNLYQSYASLLFDKNQIIPFQTATCTPFLRKLFVTVNGKILQCEKISHDFALGQITDNEVILDLEQVATQHNKYTSVYLKECKTCAVRNNCRRCVYMGKNPIKDERCYAYMTEMDLQTERSNSLTYLEEHPELYEELLNRVIIRDL